MLSSNKTASSAATCNQVQPNTRTDGRRERGVVCGGVEWQRVTRLVGRYLVDSGR